MTSWQVGDVKVTKIVELEFAGIIHHFLLLDATPDACQNINWLRPHFMNDAGELYISFHALLLETPTCRIIVDTCFGNDKKRPQEHWNMLSGSFLLELEQAGFGADSIDYVLCTHLHVDHVGWNTIWDGEQWKPTFPNARYIFAEREYLYWCDNREEQPYGDYFSDSIQPVFDAGLAELVETNHSICDEVRLEYTPGHSPGHVSVRISSRGEQGLITGDFIHHPCQMAMPHWCSTADHDQEVAERTRRRMLAQLADEESLVIGTHFAGPTAGRVVKDGDVWRLDTDL